MAAYDDTPDPSSKKVEIHMLELSVSWILPLLEISFSPFLLHIAWSIHNPEGLTRLEFTLQSHEEVSSEQNAMQGHNALFNWENKRVGFAESSFVLCLWIASLVCQV